MHAGRKPRRTPPTLGSIVGTRLARIFFQLLRAGRLTCMYARVSSRPKGRSSQTSAKLPDLLCR